MKKVAMIMLVVLFAVSPLYASAMEPGYKGLNNLPANSNSSQGENCLVWRPYMGMGTGGDFLTSYNGQSICQESPIHAKRLYELEVAVQALEQQNSQLQAQLAQGQAYAGVSVSQQSNSNLESRVTALESSMNFMLNSVVPVLQKIVLFLSKK